LEEPRTTPAEILTASQAGTSVIQLYRVGEVHVVGVKVLRVELVQQMLGLVSGEFYDESRLRKGFEELKRLYGTLGYVNFLPEPVLNFDEQRKVVNLTVNIDEGLQFTVNRIAFTGNTKTPDEVIRREIPFKEGSVFNSSALALTLWRLNQLGLFEEIRIEDFAVKPSPSEPKVDIELRVKEKP
jgi:outer membrane protein insertion porin family